MARDELGTLLSVAKKLAAAILENGGETYRAEEAVHRLCGLCGTEEIAVLALPTGVLIHLSAADGSFRSGLCRVKTRRMDLGAVAQANDVARRLAGGGLTLEEARAALARPERQKRTKTVWASAGISAFSIGCFSVMLGGGMFEFFAAAICAFLSQLVCAYFRNEEMYYFITSFAGGTICALAAALMTTLLGHGRLDIIIGASILPLLPGMTLVSAIRDSVRGDLVSGAARLGDVLVVSLALAFGIGAVLWAFELAGGVL